MYLSFRDRLAQPQQDEFDHFSAVLRQTVFAQHDEKGAHTDVTADSVVTPILALGGLSNLGAVPTPALVAQAIGEQNATMYAVTPPSQGAIYTTLSLGQPGRPRNGQLVLLFNNSAFLTAVFSNVGGSNTGIGFQRKFYLGPSANLLLVYEAAFGGGVGGWACFGEGQSNWAAYTPTWTASSVNPAIGNGSLIGRYCVHAGTNTMRVSVRVVIGSTTTTGTGTWRFGLPLPANQSTGVRCAGPFGAFDAGTAFRTGVTNLVSATEITAYTDGAVNTIGPTIPMTWAANDDGELQATVELA